MSTVESLKRQDDNTATAQDAVGSCARFPQAAAIWESEAIRPEAELWALPEERILIEVDARIIRDLVSLSAIALQMATGSATDRETLPAAIPYQSAETRLHGAILSSQEERI